MPKFFQYAKLISYVKLVVTCALGAFAGPSSVLSSTLDGATSPEAVFGSNDFTEGGNLSIGSGQLDVLRDLLLPQDIEAQLLRQVTDNPDDTDALKSLAQFYMRTARLDDAKSTLEKVYALDPDDTSAALDIARIDRGDGGVRAARASLEKFLAEARDPFPFRVALIQLGYETGAKSSARRAVADLIAEAPSPPREVKLRLLLARYLMADGAVDEARTQIDEVLASEPQHPDGLAFRALFRLNDLDLDAAQQDISAGLRGEPNNVALLRLAARADWRAGQHEDAITHLLLAVDASGHEIDVVLDAADALEATGRSEDALNLVDEAVQRNPAAAPLVARLGVLRLAFEDWDGAEKVAAALRQFETPNAIVDSEKIRLGVMRGRGLEQAAEELLAQLGSDGSDLGVVASVVNANLARGDRAAATDYISGLLEHAPSQPALLLMRASLTEIEGDAEAAEADYRKVAAAIPQSALAHISLARHLMREERPEEAEAAIRTGLEYQPNDPSLKLPLVEILLRRDAVDAALTQMEDLVRAYPDNPLVVNNYVALVTDYAAEDAAKLDLAASVAGQLRGSAVPQLRDTYGWLLHARGENEAAYEVLMSVVEDIPEDPWANYHYGMILAAGGKHDQAITHLRRALSSTDASFDKIDTVMKTLATLEGN